MDHPAVKLALEARGRKGMVVGCRCGQAPKASWEERRARYANLPHQDSPRTFETFVRIRGAEEGMDAAKEFAESDEPPHLLVLVGQVGCGKSHLLEAIGRRQLKRGKPVKYEYIPELIDRFRATHGEESETSVWEMFQTYESAETLILDDLTEQDVTTWAAQKITALVDNRYRSGLRLAVGTNLDVDDVIKVYGHRLASRLWDETGDVALVTMTCGDYRRGKR